MVKRLVFNLRIHIIGGSGSGKTYVAKLIEKQFGIKYYQLDNIVWDKTGERYPEEIRNRKLEEIIQKPSWVVEGAFYKWTHSSFKQADKIFVLHPSLSVRNYRTIKRFFKTRLGIEESNYKQDFNELMKMLQWNKDYESVNLKRIIEVTSQYKDKRVFVKRNLDILKHLK